MTAGDETFLPHVGWLEFPRDDAFCELVRRGFWGGPPQALLWLFLMKEELGDAWLDPSLFRFGASSLLGDIERQLEHHVTGRYSAGHRHPIA